MSPPDHGRRRQASRTALLSCTAQLYYRMGMFRRLFAAKRRKTPDLPKVPADHRVYAIGDIHGRIDLLEDLHRDILADAEAADATRRTIVYLGDYVDRGLHSREVVDLLIGQPLAGFETVHLIGNHEEFLLDFAQRLDHARLWLYNGGETTLRSYGVEVPEIVRCDDDLAEARTAFFEALPAHHLAFLNSLVRCHEIGDYFFAHAGVRPGVPLDRQKPEDLVWIRDELLESDDDFGKIVVHGHTISRNVEIRDNRIGIDTGAYSSGVLSCLVLQGRERSLIQT